MRFPFSDQFNYKIRPAVIVSNNEFNKKFDVWACPITSKETSQCIPLKNSLKEGKLERESYAKTNAITTLEKGLVIKKIGKTSKEKTNKIIEKIIQNIEKNQKNTKAAKALIKSEFPLNVQDSILHKKRAKN